MKKLIFAALILLMFVPTILLADESAFSMDEFIIEHKLHRYTGYAAIAAASAAALTGFLELEDVHPVTAYSAFGLMTLNTALGVIAYHRYLDEYWPHILLNSAAVVGFGLNAFVLEQGSDAHIATGAASLASMYAAVGFIIVINW